MADNFAPFLKIEPTGRKVQVTWGYKLHFKEEKNGRISVCIPPFKIFFSASTKDEARHRGRVLTRLYIDHHILHSGGLKALVKRLHTLGFTAPNNQFTLKEFLKDNRVPKTKFKSIKTEQPTDYLENEIVEQEAEMALS